MWRAGCPANGHVRLLDGIHRPAPGEPTLVNTSHNVFTTTNARQFLTERRISEFTVSGIRTEQCCETTARLAADLGFEVLFVTEATTTSGLPGLTAVQVIERTEAVLRGRDFATIVTVADFIAGSSSPTSTGERTGVEPT